MQRLSKLNLLEISVGGANGKDPGVGEDAGEGDRNYRKG